MFVLIADSGSTKTDWVLLHDKQVVKQCKTIGFNPYFQSTEEICVSLKTQLEPQLKNELKKISTVHYYGTGCSTTENCNIIKTCIAKVFNVANVLVSHDLLGAARALCKREWGIASILGTGSNSCLYNGCEVIENVPSTGYLWSDYGGGAQIGKYFIRDYFEGRLPAGLRQDFENAGYNLEIILNNVYKKAVPGKYLATVSLFVYNHLEHPYIKTLLFECFDSFFIHQISKYTNSSSYKVHTVGSIAFFYRHIVAQVAARHGYVIGNVLQSPIQGLIEYHSQ